MAAGYLDAGNPVVREALKQRAVGIAAAALDPILNAAVARGLSREEVAETSEQAIGEGGPEGVIERITTALDQAIEEKGD